MMDFDIRSLVPRFILQDRDGYAMARAMEAGLRDFLQVCRDGLDTWGHVDRMPVWRLDEMAWEYGIPYDYNAAESVKREWIRNAYDLSRLWGTPEGIVQYMAGYFDEATLEENWAYGGAPYHFRMRFPGTWTPEGVQWATRAIEQVKNVRSVLDAYTFLQERRKVLYAGFAMYTREAGTFQVAKVDADAILWYTDENGDMLLDETGMTLMVEV